MAGMLLIAVLGCSSPEPPPGPSTGSLNDGTIVAMGDSLTEGLGVDDADTYPAVLESRLIAQGYRYRVVNAGISGETSSGARSRMRWIMSQAPDIVILETGANDGFRGIDPQLIRQNIREIIEYFMENDVIVVLAGMKIVTNLGLEYTQAFEALYQKLATDFDVIFVPFFLDGVAAETSLNLPDGIHPNAAGYQKIVDHIWPHVLEAIDRHRRMSSDPVNLKRSGENRAMD
jgi:acyl-CoA thioesterase-1